MSVSLQVRAIFTDLDATLLEPDATLLPETAELLDELRAAGIPVVPVTSKTRLEVKRWLTELSLPFGVFENGAGLLGPSGARAFERAVPVARLRQALVELAGSTGLELVPLDTLDDAELSRLTGLTPEQVPAAKAREYDLPFLAPAQLDGRLERAVSEKPGLRLMRGGRFWHLLGDHDKSDGVRAVLDCAELPREGLTVGLGDAPNDADFLGAVDVAVIVPGGGDTAALRRLLPGARLAPFPAGAGWTAAVRSLLDGA